MPPTFLLFALFLAGAYVAPLVLLTAIVLAARRSTRAFGRQLLWWSCAGGLAFSALFALTARRPIFIEDALSVTAGFTVGAVLLLVRRYLDRRLGDGDQPSKR